MAIAEVVLVELYVLLRNPAHTLLENGVTDFATSNVRDFEGFGFSRVSDSLSAGPS